MIKRYLFSLVCGIMCIINAQAQLHQHNNDTTDTQTPSLTISLLTYYPGDLVYELYGHAGIKVTFPDGTGICYNYGVFDFNAPNFMYRFLKGDTYYKVVGYSADYMLSGYDRRKVVEQVLNLSPEQAQQAYAYLVNNALPWNATYRYNYVLDNCSTRPRNVIEMATGGTIKYPAMQDTTTFRKMMHRYNANYSWSQFGIDIALGSGLDRPITYREQMFVPMVLMNACAGATFECNEERVPLVAKTTILSEGDENGNILPPTPWWATPMCLFSTLLLILIAFTWRDQKRNQVTRWIDTALYSMLALYGVLLYFFIFISTHEATSPNWNGVWINPFYIIPAVLIWIKSAKKLLYCYHFVNFAVLFLLGAVWYWIPQIGNLAFLPLGLCPLVRSANYILIYRRKKLNAKQ